MKILIAILALVITANCQSRLRSLPGKKQTVDLPLALEVKGNKRQERMQLTYWTSLEEPRSCLMRSLPCIPARDFEPYFNGELVIKNVPVAGWREEHDEATKKDRLELRLAFDKHDPSGEATTKRESRHPGGLNQSVYDVLRLVYTWNKLDIAENKGWECEDGHVDEDRDDVRPEIDWQKGNGFRRDSFHPDIHQDCVIRQDLSSVTVGDNNYAAFKVHFVRPLVTRGRFDDALLSIGEEIRLSYHYR